MPTAYITAPPDAVDTLVETLLEERLVACINRFPCQSTYRWEGEIHRDDEVILLAKTTDDAYEELVERVRELHPYEVPCIERFDETDVLEAFASWRSGAVRETGG